ncbi:MAG: hypothetical protein QOI03_256 [Solirubrobacteraceae bacterium]|jgi:hypothetical protein|nr:hypothetical protein [Solirubrobacteraceae bacterium]
MSSQAARSAAATPTRHLGEQLRVAFVGSPPWLDGCAPSTAAHGMTPQRYAVAGQADSERTLAAIGEFQPHVTVIIDPLSAPVELLRGAPGVTLGLLVGGAREAKRAEGLDDLDRLASFEPELTGTLLGRSEVWRAIPPPVSDALFSDVRPARHPPRAMSIGRSSSHREAMLVAAKHHHDLLHVIHGVSGEPLRELLFECDVGVYVAPEPGGGFGLQAGMHLAAGQLLLAGELAPAHGLERNIDYLHVDSADGLAWILERLGRFPDMHRRVRVRGRLKAEQYRASRVFGRVAEDLLADVRAFGSARAGA